MLMARTVGLQTSFCIRKKCAAAITALNLCNCGLLLVLYWRVDRFGGLQISARVFFLLQLNIVAVPSSMLRGVNGALLSIWDSITQFIEDLSESLAPGTAIGIEALRA